jgi:uncharacterized membrane protein YpjA
MTWDGDSNGGLGTLYGFAFRDDQLASTKTFARRTFPPK